MGVTAMKRGRLVLYPAVPPQQKLKEVGSTKFGLFLTLSRAVSTGKDLAWGAYQTPAPGEGYSRMWLAISRSRHGWRGLTTTTTFAHAGTTNS